MFGFLEKKKWKCNEEKHGVDEVWVYRKPRKQLLNTTIDKDIKIGAIYDSINNTIKADIEVDLAERYLDEFEDINRMVNNRFLKIYEEWASSPCNGYKEYKRKLAELHDWEEKICTIHFHWQDIKKLIEQDAPKEVIRHRMLLGLLDIGRPELDEETKEELKRGIKSVRNNRKY